MISNLKVAARLLFRSFVIEIHQLDAIKEPHANCRNSL